MKDGTATVEQAKTMWCDTCNAQPDEPCTEPNGNSRKSVAWVHPARQAAYEATHA